MRGVACCVVAVLIGLAGCGEVKAKEPDGGGGTDAPSGCTGTTAACGTDNALYQCDPNSGVLTKVQDCQYGCSNGACNECQANTTFCNGDDLVMCDASGKIVNPMTCMKGCQVDHCNACMPGVSYCDTSGNAVSCGLDGMPGTPMACGANGCINGVCNSCQPNSVTCQGDTLVTCAANGTVSATTACTFGCGTTPNAHCKVFQPSYGLTVPTGTLPDVVIDNYATLDISGCANSSATLYIGTTSTTLTSPQVSSVNQTGGPPICVVRFNKLTVMAGFTLTITNDYASGNLLSLQATDDISIAGTISFMNANNGPVPGATVSVVMGNTYYIAPGAGGGGGARAGGNGGACTGCNTAPPGGGGGGAITNIRSVLQGGSHGGAIQNGMFYYGGGGQGGGAIHLLSLTRVVVASTGKLAVNGGGATTAVNSRQLGSGGGSGGTIVIEAPSVSFSANALAAANGGGGAGGCTACTGSFIPTCTDVSGQSGQLSATRAAGGNCNGAGNGGWEANGETVPYPYGANGNGASDISGGGGGGSSGFIFLRGKTGANVMLTTGAIVSPTPTVEGVTAN